MKKSLIAVAALAAVGAASAQSSVTLYGVIDTGYGMEQTKQKLSVGATANATAFSVTEKRRSVGLMSGNLSGSRWGLKGQEDLGNGLSAVFNVEAGFDSTNGSFNGGFNRRSVVGLKGSFGQVLLGRDYTPMDEIGGGDYYQASDLVTGDGVITLSDGSTIGKDLYTNRADGIHYAGEFGGVGVKAFVGYNEDKTTTTVNTIAGGTTTSGRIREEGYGVGVSYAGGPFRVGASVQQFRTKNSTSTTAKQTQYGIGASYDFTAAKLYAHYIANDDRDSKPMQQFGLGVTAPFGAFTLGAQYAYNYWKGPTYAVDYGGTTYGFASSDKAKGHDFVLQGTYALSKRTDLYARAARTNSWKAKNAAHTLDTKTDSFAVGIRHRF